MLRELSLKPEGITLYDRLIFLASSGASTSSTQLKLSIPLHTLYDDLDLKDSTPFQLMLMSENVLAKEWDTPEEDEIWAHL